jgi:hypothetical protein
VKGRKRNIVTDTSGSLVHAIVHSADIQDRDGAPIVLQNIRYSFACLNRNRRLAKDFENSIASATAWLVMASVQLPARWIEKA